MATTMVRRVSCAVLLFAAAGCLGTGEDPQTEAKEGAVVASVPVACAHSPCVQGGVLAVSCGPDLCVTEICNADPYCCGVQWDSVCVAEVGSICQKRCDCGTMCNTSAPDNAFYADACSCVSLVCSADPYCCNSHWDSVCVSEAVRGCHITCQ